MSRRNFTTAIKVACIKRATHDDGLIYCEGCGALAKRFEIDHDTADGLGGEPTLANAKLLCKPCHDEKTPSDVAKIAKAKRREAKDLGIRPDKPAIPSRPKAEKQRRVEQMPLPPRRPIYRNADQ
jgi:hypothetical protein